MFQEYYKRRVKYWSKRMDSYKQKNLIQLNGFLDAVEKYKIFKQLYDKTAYYISKLQYENMISQVSIYTQIKDKLNELCNEKMINSLSKHSEQDSLMTLKKVEQDLNNSYGYGFDDMILQYHQAVHKVIEKHDIIYKNYHNNTKEDNNINIDDFKDPLYEEVIKFCIQNGKVSSSLLQRKFRFGYNRACYIIDQLEKDGVVGPKNGSNPRKVLIHTDSKDYISNKLIDFDALYGIDYDALEKEKQLQEEQGKEARKKIINEYVDNAQSYFDSKGLNIKFQKNQRIDLTKLDNVLFTNTDSEEIETLVNEILSMSVPNELKLLLIDFSQVNLSEYNGLSNLLGPVITDYKLAKHSIENLRTEMNRRYKLFLQNRVKNISTYNNKMDNDNKLLYIGVVINELFEMLKFENTREILTELLLNCKNAGIVFICYSKFNQKNIRLRMLDDLFEIHDHYPNNYLEYDNKDNNAEIENILK